MNDLKKHIGNTGMALLSVCLSLFLPHELSAQTQVVDTVLFQNMEYRVVGPHRGGRSIAIAGHTDRQNEYYFGATGGGLWKTTDGGLTWNPVTDGQINSSSVGAVDVADSDPDIVYIGMGESEFRGNIMQGDGVYKSTDAGKTWEHVGLEDSQTIARIRIHPTNPDIVYAAVLGHPFGPNEERGVFKTTDGGKSWKKVLYKGPEAGAVDLILDPANPETVYASIWKVHRKPWKMWGGGEPSGLFKSTDGGETWEELTEKPGMPEAPVGKIGVTVSPADPNRVWAIIEANEGGVFRSDDGGETWKQVNNDRDLRQRAFYYTRIYADPKDKEKVYVLNVQFWKSTDGGETYDDIKVPHGDNHDLWIDPNNPERMAEANDGGGTISINGGETWTDEDFPTAQLYHITATNDFPYFVAGAQQDNSTVAVASEGWDFLTARQNSIKKLSHSYAVGGGESGYIAQDPNNLDVFYAGSYSGVLTRINRKTGERRRIEPYPRYFMGEAAETLPERVHWTYPIVFSPLEDRLYVTSQHVWTTTSEGQSWKKISPDLTYADPETMGVSGGEITLDMSGPELYATVYALAPSYHDVNTIWAGSDDGLLHITRNHGESWENITPTDMIPKDSRISIIDASRHRAGTAYVAVKRYQMNDRSPYIFKTNDYGKTWKKIVNGIPEGHYVHAVREDNKRPGLLYAGTEHGMYVSFDDGENWQSLQLNLPDVAIRDLVVTDKDIAIATHGRSMWILDDIAPIREYSEDVLKKDLHLYKPYDAVRRVQDAVFYYHLGKESDEVTIEIMDSSGKLVQEFTTKEASDKKEDGKETKKENEEEKEEEDEEDEDEDEDIPSNVAGLNTFTWDLRYPGATVFDDMILWSARPEKGPLVTPGIYKVKVTANGKTETQGFEVKLDSRLQDITEADIEEQFTLLMKIRDKLSEANEAVINIREYKEKKGENIDPTILKKLNDIEKEIYQVKNESRQDPLNFPIKLNNKIASLGLIVDSGEAKPTDGAYQVFDELSEELSVLINRLNTIFINEKRGKKIKE